MKYLLAFSKLIRLNNLVFIVIAQCLFRYCIILPVYHQSNLHPILNTEAFIAIIISSICIAAGGNIINDYFDLNIDQINKPNKVIVGKIIGRRWVLLWHIIVSAIGLLAVLYASKLSGVWWISLANAVCILLLFIYSISLKKKLLSGNILISLLTAWVILILCLAEMKVGLPIGFNALAQQKIYKLGIVYAGFAFIISLIREVVKDMEDELGDRKWNCNTVPIAWGFTAAKILVNVWIVLLIVAVFILALYGLQLGWYISFGYSMASIVLPGIWLFKQVVKAQQAHHYHRISTAIKWMMLLGLLGMFFLQL